MGKVRFLNFLNFFETPEDGPLSPTKMDVLPLSISVLDSPRKYLYCINIAGSYLFAEFILKFFNSKLSKHRNLRSFKYPSFFE